MTGLPVPTFTSTLAMATTTTVSRTEDGHPFTYISPPSPGSYNVPIKPGFQAANTQFASATSNLAPSMDRKITPFPTSATGSPQSTPDRQSTPLHRRDPTTASMRRCIRELRPAPPQIPGQDLPASIPRRQTCFYDLPAELRNMVYRIVLKGVHIHILPQHSGTTPQPHSLIATSHQVRLEVLPIIHSTCEIRASITDFNFEPLLTWLSRVPPEQESTLSKNNRLKIRLCTSLKPDNPSGASLRRWLQIRADTCRPQPEWQYSGPTPKTKVANDLKRRAKRMTEEGKRKEMMKILRAIKISFDEDE